jgi:hypothetical protein
MTPVPTRLRHSLRARCGGLSLDRELAGGRNPAGNTVLAARVAVLSSCRGRRRIAAGLRRVLADAHRRGGRSAAAACDREAVATARPALEQLERAIRERGVVRIQGLALAHLLLTDPGSALYASPQPETLYEVARAALLALHTGDVEPSRVPGRGVRQMARAA